MGRILRSQTVVLCSRLMTTSMGFDCASIHPNPIVIEDNMKWCDVRAALEGWNVLSIRSDRLAE